MKRRILLVDDDVAVLLTFKAVLEISGFDVETAASAREGKSRIRSREYHMVISDMRMESDLAGREVIQAARTAAYHPAVALLTAFPDEEVGWDGVGPDKVLIKATHTRLLLQQIEKLFNSHAVKLSRLAVQAAGAVPAIAASANDTSATPPKAGPRSGRSALRAGSKGKGSSPEVELKKKSATEVKVSRAKKSKGA